VLIAGRRDVRTAARSRWLLRRVIWAVGRRSIASLEVDEARLTSPRISATASRAPGKRSSASIERMWSRRSVALIVRPPHRRRVDGAEPRSVGVDDAERQWAMPRRGADRAVAPVLS